MDIAKIGELIKRERCVRGMTQEELGAMIGVGKAQICKIESDLVKSVKTINKVVDALGMTLDIRLTPQRLLNSNVAGFLVACISEFAASYNLTIREASNYLKRYNGLAFLITHYDVQHLLSIEDSVGDLARVCNKNGGAIL